MATYSPDSLGIKAPSGGFQQGGWYGGRQYWGGTLSDPGQIHESSNQVGAGQNVSNEVIAQTDPANVPYIEAQRLQAGVNAPYRSSSSPQGDYISSISSEVANAKKALEETLGKQRAENDAKLLDLRQKEQSTLGKMEDLSKPFREEIEKTEREKLHINENFEANQKLVGELEQLLTEGNEYIKQQKDVTGLSAVRNPRIQKSIDEVAARVGVIEAVMNARNGQIAQAQNMIDRTINAISADRNDQISYYQTVLSLNRQDILSLDDDNKRIAGEQIEILKTDLSRAQATADYVKELMINPSTAMLMGQAGVSLNDSVETVNSKLTRAQQANEIREISNKMSMDGYVTVFDPKSVPANQLVTITDANGKKHYYRKALTGDAASSPASIAEKFGFKIEGQSVASPQSSPYDSLIMEVLKEGAAQQSGAKPTFKPAGGNGTTYTDPTTNTSWQYQNGWQIKNTSSLGNFDFSTPTANQSAVRR